MRELAYIQKISSLTPIPGADKIEKAQVLGWELVVKKGEFSVGDLCVYVEIDSILPELPCFEFLRQRKFRVKTIKLKNQVSQGIAFHPSILKEVDPSIDLSSIKLGQDVTETLQIIKYDAEAALDLPQVEVKKSWLERKLHYYKWKLFGIKPIKKGDFPSDVPKTDETRVQKMGAALEKYAGEEAYITEKMEGGSSTFIYRKTGNWLAKLFGKSYVFQVCSRNRIVYNSQKRGSTDHFLYKISEKYDILSVMKKLNRNLAIQGEIVGPKIQGNVYKLPELALRIFLIFDIDKQKYVCYDELLQLIALSGLPMVPVLEHNHIIKNDIKYYVELSKGKSKENLTIDREGIVIKLKNENFSFKSINIEYLLKQNE